MRSLISVIAALVVLSGCHAKANAPGEAPTGVTVTPGDGLVVVNWDPLPDLSYWIFYQAGSTVDVASPNSTAIRRALNPRVIPGLANQTEYAFAMNATHNDSSAGPSSPPIARTPVLAGTNWFAGTPLPLGTPANLRGLVLFGTRFVTVGDATTNGTVTTPTILAGDFSYTTGQFSSTSPNPPQGVTDPWMPPTMPPPGFAASLTSVTSNGAGYVALAGNGSVISSADGLNWTNNSTVPATGMNGIAFAFAFAVTPTYAAVGNGGNIFKANDINIPTGFWSSVASGTTNDLTGVFLLPTAFFVTGAGGTLLESVDAINWGVPLTTNTTNTLRGIAFCGICPGVQIVAVGDSGTIITGTIVPGSNPISITTWNVVDPATFTPPFSGPLPNLLSVTVGGAAGTRFLAVGQGGAVVYSDDGVKWYTASSGSSNLAQVQFFGGLYLSVGDAGANVVSR